jgi:bacterioferritin-associated ferredoxin
MDPDDHVCLCYRVSLRKITAFMNRVRPAVPSQLSECLNAGTGCHWCVPFLRRLHEQWQAGETPDLDVSPEVYARRRRRYHLTGQRGEAAPSSPTPPTPTPTPDRSGEVPGACP